MRRDDAILLDIILACETVAEFTQDYDCAAFIADPKTHAAVTHVLFVIGQATKRLSADFREQHREIPCQALADTGDALLRDYDKVDLHEVWRMATHDLPALLAQLRPLIPPPM